MRIVCPSCQATYEVPKTLLTDAVQNVRCARCGMQWLPTPLESAPADAPLIADPPPAAKPNGLAARLARGAPPSEEVPTGLAGLALAQPAPPPARQSSRRRLGLVTVLAWLVSLSLFAAAAWAVVDRRPQIEAAWPPSARLYKLLGLD